MRQLNRYFFGIFWYFGESVICEPMKSVASGPASALCLVSTRLQTFSDWQKAWNHESSDWSIIKFVHSRTSTLQGFPSGISTDEN